MFFSKALFKQSMKANWVKWLSVTLATCVMLAIVIIVLGSLSINDIRDSLKNVFTQADQESVLKENAIDSYDAYLTTTDFENGIVSITSNPLAWNYYLRGQVTNTYDTNKTAYETENGAQPEGEALAQIQNQTAAEIVQNLRELAGQVGQIPGFEDMLAMLENLSDEQLAQFMLILIRTYEQNPTDFASSDNATLIAAANEVYYDYVYEVAYETYLAKEDQTPESAASAAASAEELAGKAVVQYQTLSSQSSFVYSQELFKPYAQTEVNEMIKSQVLQSFNLPEDATDEQRSEAEQYAVAAKVISNTAISTYELWLSEGATAEDARIEATASITDQIDEKVAEALSELGNMDIYGLIIGSIFYRIAGILLPMVYVIMVANGLLAGQVDSGSMAYVLSTPTKRRTVSTTQMLYLLVSLFAMFACVTAVSVVSIWIVGGNAFAINFGEILLFNLGAFLTMFAFAGFCFMCSAIFNRTKYSLSIGGGISIFMLVCTILGLFGSSVVPSAMRIDQMNFFNYLSLITLFDTTSILSGGLFYLIGFGVLAIVGIVTFVVGTFCFDKKDLPL